MAEDKILERVAKLLALAEHPNTPAPEAEVALLQAHKLMAKHAIEEALVRQAQSVGERRQLIRMDIPVGGGYTFRAYLRTILDYNAEANRCSVAFLSDGSAAVFGADEDVRWVAMLHQMIHLQFLSKIDPKWDEAKSYDENVYNFKVAGHKWYDINDESVKHGGPDARVWRNVSGRIDLENELPFHYGSRPQEVRNVEIFDRGEYSAWGKWDEPTNKIKGSMIAAYKRHAKLVGDTEPVSTQSHQAYRRTYAEAFRRTMARRFLQMVREAEAERDTIPGAALALRDLKDEANRMMWDAFPNLSPEAAERAAQEAERIRRRQAAERDAMLEKMTPKQREEFLEKEERAERRAARANARYWDKRSAQHDVGAHNRGAAAAASVDLTRKAGYTDSAKTRQEIR